MNSKKITPIKGVFKYIRFSSAKCIIIRLNFRKERGHFSIRSGCPNDQDGTEQPFNK